jgi:mannose/fructose-specific phosphotransferase system component IIA
MRKYLIVTHGKMAEGIVQSIEMVLGKRNDLKWLCAYVDDNSLSELINPVLETYDDSDEIIVFTDISHGSVNQFFTGFLKTTNYHIITGFNLALVLSIMLLPINERLNTEMIQNEIEFAREQMIYMNAQLVSISPDDELD